MNSAYLARDGDFEALKKAFEEDKNCLTPFCMAFAAEMGYLTILKWLDKNHCPRSTKIFSHAAYGGFMNVLRWLKTHHFPLDGKEATMYAVLGNHADVLNWLVKEMKCDVHPECCNTAAFFGFFNVFKIARLHNGGRDLIYCLSQCRWWTNIEMIDWVFQN